MTTTKPGRPGPTASDLRYYVTALLALVYASAWWTFGLAAPEEIVGDPERGADAPVTPPRAVWYQDLPPERRPVVHLAPNLRIHVASAAEPPTRFEAPVRPVRMANNRPGRVRTRSS